jgi:hypothetical protein
MRLETCSAKVNGDSNLGAECRENLTLRIAPGKDPNDRRANGKGEILHDDEGKEFRISFGEIKSKGVG